MTRASCGGRSTGRLRQLAALSAELQHHAARRRRQVDGHDRVSSGLVPRHPAFGHDHPRPCRSDDHVPHVLDALRSPAWYSSRTPTLSWTASSDSSGINDYSWSTTTASDTTPDGGPDGTAATTTLSSLADGVWYFHVRARDGAGHWGPASHFKLQIDGTAPTGSMTINGGDSLTNSTAAVLIPSVTDTYTPTASLQMRWSTNGGSSWTAWSAYGSPVVVTLPAGDGSKEVRAQYRDLAGNTLATRATPSTSTRRRRRSQPHLFQSSEHVALVLADHRRPLVVAVRGRHRGHGRLVRD